MTDPTYETESHHTPESRDRDARFVGYEAGPDRLGGMSFDAATHVLTALRKSLYSEGAKRNSEVIALNTVLHMVPRLEAEAEGSAAIIAAERAEVLNLRDQLASTAMPETPTSAQLHSVCLSLRNDYGLMKREDQEALKLQTWECWKAISCALAEQEGE